MHVRKRSLTFNLPNPSWLVSCFSFLRVLQNPKSFRQDEYDNNQSVSIPYPWAYIRTIQIATGLFFIITFVVHINTGGSGGVWPTLAIGCVTFAYASFMLFLRLHRRYKVTLTNMTIFFSIIDTIIAAFVFYFYIYMISNGQWHWYQCRYYYWGRSCVMQRYQDAATFLDCWSSIIAAMISLYTAFRIRRRNSLMIFRQYSFVPLVPDHDFRKYSIDSLSLFKKQKQRAVSTDGSCSDEETLRGNDRSPRASTSTDNTVYETINIENGEGSSQNNNKAVSDVRGDEQV